MKKSFTLYLTEDKKKWYGIGDDQYIIRHLMYDTCIINSVSKQYEIIALADLHGYSIKWDTSLVDELGMDKNDGIRLAKGEVDHYTNLNLTEVDKERVVIDITCRKCGTFNQLNIPKFKSKNYDSLLCRECLMDGIL